jgi:hypothetical protein
VGPTNATPPHQTGPTHRRAVTNLLWEPAAYCPVPAYCNSDADAARINNNNNADNIVYMSTSDMSSTMTGHYGGYTVGDTICKSAYTTGFASGVITSQGVTETQLQYPGGRTVYVDGLHKADFTIGVPGPGVDAGDSGAPAFNNHLFAGILSGATGSFTTDQKIEQVLNVEMCYTNNCQ